MPFDVMFFSRVAVVSALLSLSYAANAVPLFAGHASDPIGDQAPNAFHPGCCDLTDAAAVVDSGGFVALAVRFAPGATTGAHIGFNIDIDQDPTTGFPGVDTGGSDSAIFGTDFIVFAGTPRTAAEVLEFVGGSFVSRGTFTQVTLPDGLDVIIPFSVFGNDGLFNFKVVSQAHIGPGLAWTGILDYLTDVGAAPGTTRAVPAPITLALLGLGLAGLAFARKRR